MKTIIEYQCEICNGRHSQESEAIKCEERGRFDITKFTVGFMFAYEHNGYVGIFSIPKTKYRPYQNPHLGMLYFWACRATSMGDSFPDLCGSDLISSDNKTVSDWYNYRIMPKKYINCDEFKRMVRNLKSLGITPSYMTENGLITVK
jgi:hypothetical protein